MKLIELEPEWVSQYNPQTHGMRRFSDSHSHVDYGGEIMDAPPSAESIGDAQGVMFLCPVCFAKNKGAVGTEHILCWFGNRGVPADALPGPGRWTASGTGFNDLTLSPSVNVDHEHWHGFVINGEIR